MSILTIIFILVNTFFALCIVDYEKPKIKWLGGQSKGWGTNKDNMIDCYLENK